MYLVYCFVIITWFCLCLFTWRKWTCFSFHHCVLTIKKRKQKLHKSILHTFGSATTSSWFCFFFNSWLTYMLCTSMYSINAKRFINKQNPFHIRRGSSWTVSGNTIITAVICVTVARKATETIRILPETSFRFIQKPSHNIIITALLGRYTWIINPMYAWYIWRSSWRHGLSKNIFK